MNQNALGELKSPQTNKKEPKPLASKMAAVKKVGQKIAKSDLWLSIYSVTI